MRRLSVIAAASALLLAAGCGSSGGGKATTASSTAATSTTQPAMAAPPGRPGARRRGPVGPVGPRGRGAGGGPAGPGQRVRPGRAFAFKTPSGKIGCYFTRPPPTLRCDTAFPTSFSHSAHHCRNGDYGQAFEIVRGVGRAAAICAGDTVLGMHGAQTIPYGRSWMIGPFSCTSKTSSLTCIDILGHGWRLARGAQRLF